MINFADTGWQVIAAFAIFVIGLLFAIYQRSIFKIENRISIIIYVWHTLVCMFYFYYSLNNVADAKSYYISSIRHSEGFGFGTKGVTFIVSIFSDTFGMSYGDVFLIFNIFGAVGLLAWASALLEILPEQYLPTRRFAIAALFLPGASFWSAGIGKDSLAFMATGLAMWASLQLKSRYPAMLLALGVIFVVRPHIGGIAIAALALALTFALRSGIGTKAALLAVAVPAAVAGLWFGLDYAGISNPAGMSEITDYIEERQGYNMEGGSSIDINSMSWPVRLFSYLFRPLPLESPGFLGLVVGFENIVLLGICVFFLLKVFKVRSRLPLFPRAFMLLFAFGMLVVLANTTANLGIAIRQKWMFVPMLICVAFSYAKTRSPAARSDELACA